jgi:hypothetical protein
MLNKYFEDKYLEEVKAYVEGTYEQHYSNDEIQLIDIWKSRGTLESTAVDVAIKYLWRYGKKEGFNRKDLLKAVHYILMAMHAQDIREGYNKK